MIVEISCTVRSSLSNTAVKHCTNN